MDVIKNIELFQELVRCGNDIYTWCYDADGQLLRSNCPDEALLGRSDRIAISVAENIYGTIILWKLIPQERMAMISESAAIFDVKKITVMKMNSGENMFMKYGTKLT